MLNVLAKMAGMVPATDAQHMGLLNKILRLAANVQIFGAAGVAVVCLIVVIRKREQIYRIIKRR